MGSRIFGLLSFGVSDMLFLCRNSEVLKFTEFPWASRHVNDIFTSKRNREGTGSLHYVISFIKAGRGKFFRERGGQVH